MPHCFEEKSLSICGKAPTRPAPRQLDGNVRLSRALEERRQLTATRAERRLLGQVDFRRQMRPIAFVDPGAFVGMNPENASNFCIARLSGRISVNGQRRTSHKKTSGQPVRPAPGRDSCSTANKSHAEPHRSTHSAWPLYGESPADCGVGVLRVNGGTTLALSRYLLKITILNLTYSKSVLL
jgi:hypothetical protein